MEQDQFKIRMSVSTKLILLIGFLLTTPIIFLNLSAINLFRGDKKAYVFDSQATSAALAGREFRSYVDSSLTTLKLMVGTTREQENFSEEIRNNINFYLDNQKNLIGGEIYRFSVATSEAKITYEYFLSQQLENLSIDKSYIYLDPTIFGQSKDQLFKNGFFFKNLTKEGLAPLMAVFFADPAQIAKDQDFNLAVGYINLTYFLDGLSKSFNKFIISNNLGDVLLHSDSKALGRVQNIQNEEIFKDAQTSAFNSGAKEYYSSDRLRMLGSYYKPGLNLTVLSLIEFDKAMLATYTLTEKFMVLAIAALGVMIIIGLIFSKRLIYPLNRLFDATTEVSAGNFDINIPVTSTDEIGALTKSFVSMSKKIVELIKQMLDKMRLDQELEIAKTVQQSLFPPTEIKDDKVHLCSFYQSATECGGDWWGHFVNGNKHIVIIADATGHGLPSALMTASARSCFSVIEKLASESNFNLNASEILGVANRVIYEAAHGKIMMTCFVGILDFDTHKIQFSSAGHNPPWLLSQKAGGKTKINSLVATGQRLGEVRNVETPYEMKDIAFNQGDILFLYTDGLLEGSNLEKECYGKKRARSVIEGSFEAGPNGIIQNVMNEFLAFNGPKALDDDVTLAVAKILL